MSICNDRESDTTAHTINLRLNKDSTTYTLSCKIYLLYLLCRWSLDPLKLAGLAKGTSSLMGLDMRSSFPSRVSNRTRRDSASWLSCSFFKTTRKKRPILGNTWLTTGKEQCHHKKRSHLVQLH